MSEMMRNFAKDVQEFNDVVAGESTFNSRRFALYLGLILEEVSETIEPMAPMAGEINILFEVLKNYADDFKKGRYDHLTEGLTGRDRIDCLDGVIDTAVVALGAGHALGADVVGAANHIMDTNLAKFPVVDGVRTVIRDENGKVKKPPGWTEPNLAPFIR